MKLLLTRPEPGASRTAARLRELGHEVALLPCLSITPLPPRLPQAPTAVILTSGQAIAALPASLHNSHAFCVGDVTADNLRLAGFTRVESANGNADDLFKLVIARGVKGPHLLAVGERQGQALAAKLRGAGVSVIRRKVYRAAPLRALPPGFSLHGISGALFYSAETAKAFVRLHPSGTAALTAYALSPAVAAALAPLPWTEIRAALAPTEADLMALIP